MRNQFCIVNYYEKNTKSMSEILNLNTRTTFVVVIQKQDL